MLLSIFDQGDDFWFYFYIYVFYSNHSMTVMLFAKTCTFLNFLLPQMELYSY